jgi:hypothetical protein
MMSEDLRYPIGEFKAAEVSPEERENFIKTIEQLPAKLRAAVGDLTEEQLDTPYRPEGWTVRQVVHHVADSHINSLCRFKLGLSEDKPTIKPYKEASWAEMADAKFAPIDLSLNILDGVHARLTRLLKSMTDADFAREINHPEIGTLRLDALLALYDWHSRHHTAHVTSLRERSGW